MASSAIRYTSIVFRLLPKGPFGVRSPARQRNHSDLQLRSYVAAAIKSVLAQSFKDLEIVVVDDGSTDETTETLRPFAERIRYIPQVHRGLAAARNVGIRVARGRYLAFLDSDDLWLPDKVSMQVARLDAEPAVGVVY